MMKRLTQLALLLTLLLLLPVAAWSQSGYTTVTATVTDPSGAPYSSGSVFVTFYAGTSGVQPLLNGSTFQTSYASTLTSAGVMSLSLPDNSVIAKSGATGTQWIFTFRDVSGAIAFSYQVTISGSSQNISSGVVAAAKTLPSVPVASSTQYPVLTADPPAALANTVRVYQKSGGLYEIDQNASVTAIGGSTPGGGNTVQYQNRSAGTLLNGLASLVAPVSGGIVQATPAGSTSGAIGIVISGAGTSGIATIQTSGVALCVFDNTPTTAYYAVISSTVNGSCHAVATYPTSGQVIGRVQDGTGNVLLYPEVQASFPINNLQNPTANATFNYGTSIQQVTAPGTFVNSGTNTIEGNFFFGLLGGQTIGSANCPFYGTGSDYVTAGIVSNVCTPSTGTTNAEEYGIYGRVFVNDSTAGGQFGDINGIGINSLAQCNVTNTKCWAYTGVSSDNGVANGGLFGEEIGMQVGSTSTIGAGYMASYSGAAQATGDNMPAFYVNPSSSHHFTSGYTCGTASISIASNNLLPCINIYEFASGASNGSMDLVFHSTNGSSTDVPIAINGKVDTDGVGSVKNDSPTSIYFSMNGYKVIPSTFSALTTFAACDSTHQGMLGYITDGQSGLAWGTALSGSNTGGANATPYGVQCNGTSYTVMSK